VKGGEVKRGRKPCQLGQYEYRAGKKPPLTLWELHQTRREGGKHEGLVIVVVDGWLDQTTGWGGEKKNFVPCEVSHQNEWFGGGAGKA